MSDSALLGPLYQRIYAVLVQRITDGEYEVGDPLPTESLLTEEFRVSKATVRKAVDELVRRGLVARRQGSGTFVTDGGGELHDATLTGSVEDIVGGTPDLQLLDVQLVDGMAFPKEAQRWLGQDSGTVYRVLRGIDGTAVVGSFHFLADRLSASVTREELLDGGGMIRLLRSRGMELELNEQFISSRLADVMVAQLLDVPVGSPMLLASRELAGAQGPLESTRMWYRGDLLRLQVTLDL